MWEGVSVVVFCFVLGRCVFFLIVHLFCGDFFLIMVRFIVLEKELYNSNFTITGICNNNYFNVKPMLSLFYTVV